MGLLRTRPTARIGLGLVLMAVSYPLAWPAMTLLGAWAVRWRSPVLGAVGVPVLYGLSWLVWMLGVWITGRESLRYANEGRRWCLYRLAKWALRTQPIGVEPPGGQPAAASGASEPSDKADSD
jgi:hypothetical protein